MNLLGALALIATGAGLILVLVLALAGDAGPGFLKLFGLLLAAAGLVVSAIIMLFRGYGSVVDYVCDEWLGGDDPTDGVGWAALVFLISLCAGVYYYRRARKGPPVRAPTRVAMALKILALLAVCGIGIFLCIEGTGWGDGMGASFVVFFGEIITVSLCGLGLLALLAEAVARRWARRPSAQSASRLRGEQNSDR